MVFGVARRDEMRGTVEGSTLDFSCILIGRKVEYWAQMLLGGWKGWWEILGRFFCTFLLS